MCHLALWTSVPTVDRNVWVLDSGATVHVTGDKTLFASDVQPCNDVITVWGNTQQQATLQGTVILNMTTTDETTVTLTLKKDRYVPVAANTPNLFALDRLTHQRVKDSATGHSVLLGAESFIILSDGKHILL